MAQDNPASLRTSSAAGAVPTVRVEVRLGAGRVLVHEVSDGGFLVGSVPGCDLRLPGAGLPPVICLLTRHSAGVSLRKLVATQPVFVNGKPPTVGLLRHGDRVTVGSAELSLQITGGEGHEAIPAPAAPVAQPPRDELLRREQELKARAEQLDRQQQELAATRQEMLQLRQQLYDRYRERRDRLAGLQEAVDRAARKVQERKREIDADAARRSDEQAAWKSYAAELDTRALALQEREQTLASRGLALEARQAEIEAREQQLHRDQAAQEQGHAQFQADLVRLDRLRAALDEREHAIFQREQTVEQQTGQLQQAKREWEDKGNQINLRQEALTAEAELLRQQRTAHEAAAIELVHRTTALEGQQAMLTSLRARLERLRDEQRHEAQQLAEQRARLETREADLRQREQDAQKLRTELDLENQSREDERRRFAERGAVMEQAVVQLRQVQEKVAAEEAHLQARVLALNAAVAEQAEEASLLRARSEQVLALQERLAADRQAFREREQVLVQSEQVREALQEQLRRRSEELNARQRTLSDQARQLEAANAAVEARRAEIEHERHQTTERLAALQQDAERRAAELDIRQAEWARQAEIVRQQADRLKEIGRAAAGERKAWSDERRRAEAAQREAAAALERARADFDTARQEVLGLHQQVPDWELRAAAACERLAQARELLRVHLAELHAYARQGQDDLEELRAQVQAQAEGVRQQELVLHRARDEHRLAVAAFRQQVLEWQGQVAEMKRSLVRGETQLERRQARVEEQARQVETTSARLAQQAEQLQERERVVAGRRDEVERHLADMREWYRRKLRELILGKEQDAPAAVPQTPRLLTHEDRADILPLAGDVEPGDRQLGELLRSLDLVDGETLAALLVEARKQRRTLRQAMLAGGFLTLYQIALIEAGNLDGLVLGPTRVIDRLRATPREAVYRVHDPRRGQDAVLRHLAEAEMEDAVRPDEFRQRFAQLAALRHPNLSATWEVLEIANRPAALQEFLTGLPGTDWPPLTAVPGVWFRLLGQAALGLHTAHQAGLVHGRLDAAALLLTDDGLVKVCGVGEPPWLAPYALAPEDAGSDVHALGRLASEWLCQGGARKGTKAKPLPEALMAILNRLTASVPAEQYAGAADLLDALDAASGSVPANAEAWERLLRHVNENGSPGASLRQSA